MGGNEAKRGRKRTGEVKKKKNNNKLRKNDLEVRKDRR